MVMRRILGTLTLALVLALPGCGEDGAAGSASDAGQGDSGQADTAAPHVTLVSAAAGGGANATHVSVLEDDAALGSYARQFSMALRGAVTRAAARIDVGDDEVLVAQVVAIGCDIPTDASVTGADEAAAIVAKRTRTTMRECLAPVTTVGLAAVTP
jgi:hypothetical protein